MKTLSDFKCPNGHITEAYIDNTAQNIVCECGEMADKQIGANQILKKDGLPIGIMGDAWAKKHSDRTKLRRKQGYIE